MANVMCSYLSSNMHFAQGIADCFSSAEMKREQFIFILPRDNKRDDDMAMRCSTNWTEPNEMKSIIWNGLVAPSHVLPRSQMPYIDFWTISYRNIATILSLSRFIGI